MTVHGDRESGRNGRQDRFAHRALDSHRGAGPVGSGAPEDTHTKGAFPGPSPQLFYEDSRRSEAPLAPATQAEGSEALQVRLAGPVDADIVAAIHTASWRTAYRGILDDEFLDGPLDDYSRDRWRAWFTLIGGPRAHLALAERDGDPVGFVCVVHSGGEFGDLVANLHVLLDARGLGIGRRLLREAARLVHEEGHQAMHLWVYSGNSEAIRFYEREGGVAESEQPHLAADGIMRPSWRYLWPDVTSLLGE